MPIDLTTSTTSSDIHPFSYSTQSLKGLLVQTTDAVAQIKALFQAYQCLENLSLPRNLKPAALTLSDKELYSLISSLNEPMRRQIDEAHAACTHLLNCIQQDAPD